MKDKKYNELNLVCMMPDCNRSSYGVGRGQCASHYTMNSHKVNKKKITWGELEEKGWSRKKLTREENNKRRAHPYKRRKQ